MFSYKGVDTDYKYKIGTVQADSELEAMKLIKEEENILIIVSLNRASKIKAFNTLSSRIGKQIVRIENRMRASRTKKRKEKKRKESKKVEVKSLSQKSPVLRMIKSVSNKMTNREESQEVEIPNEYELIFKGSMGNEIIENDELIENKISHSKREPKDDKQGREINWELLDSHEESPEIRENNKLKVKSKEILMFTRRLHIMLSSGVPLLSSLTLMQETGSKNMSLVLNGILEDIRVGNSFSESIAKYPKVFNASYVSLVSIGETSGELSECLTDIIKMREQEQKVLKKVRTASIYPAVVGFVLVLMMIAASMFFLPKFEEMYQEQDLVVPEFTRIVFGIAEMLPYMVIAAIIAFIVMIFLRKRIPKVNHFYVGVRDRLFLTIPILKDISGSLYMYYFSSTVSLMLKNGIRLSDTLELAGRSINNIYIKNEIANVGELMTHGLSFSEALEKQAHFDDILINITLTGEESGQMVFSLTKVSEYYDTELNNKVDAMMEVVPPASIVLISVITAPIIIAAYLPILEISSGGLGGL